ncbi:MAG: sulfatase activating formylglycine-generating enzyme [Pseudohongiellaceae bacterium]|jgi:formylglycine-generating enzyme required for sulfatase activity
MLPVNNYIEQASDIETRAYPLKELMNSLYSAKNKLNIVVLDACRNDPFKNAFGRSAADNGLGQILAPTGTLIAYSTSPEKTAEDGRGQRNSPYTRHLLNSLRIPDLKLGDVFKTTRIGVMKDTGGRQVPWENSSIIGDFYFIGQGTSQPIAKPIDMRNDALNWRFIITIAMASIALLGLLFVFMRRRVVNRPSGNVSKSAGAPSAEEQVLRTGPAQNKPFEPVSETHSQRTFPPNAPKRDKKGLVAVMATVLVLAALGYAYTNSNQKVDIVVIPEKDSNATTTLTPVTNNAGASQVKQYALTVNSIPKDAVIKVTDIKPKYRAGMLLAPRQYHISVSKKGYLTHKQRVDIVDQDEVRVVVLKEDIDALFGIASDKMNEGFELWLGWSSDGEMALYPIFEAAMKGNVAGQFLITHMPIPRSIKVDLLKRFSFQEASLKKWQDDAYRVISLLSSQGHAYAQFLMMLDRKHVERTDDKSANDLLEKQLMTELHAIANKGFVWAQFSIGNFYNFGDQGFEKNLDEALKYYRMAAKQGLEMAREGIEAVTKEQAAQANDLLELGLQFVVIPAGTYQRGSNDGDSTEQPVERVNIASFKLLKYEVTQKQWQAVMGDNPSSFKDCGANCPVEGVSWDNIQKFIQKLNQCTGQYYRLPSEAEWEYAARAKGNTKYSWGNSISCNKAQYDGGEGSACYYLDSNGHYRGTAKVGSFSPNDFGLYDMHGNVWEWVQDCYHDSYRVAPSTNKAWGSGNCAERVLRGGSWKDVPYNLRSAVRFWTLASYRPISGGFRLAQGR